MSYTTIFFLKKDKVLSSDFKNAFRGAMYVWNDFAKRYCEMDGFPLNNEECWIFNPDECSHPQSLVCPVVMSADDFRELIKQAGHWWANGCEECNHGAG